MKNFQGYIDTVKLTVPDNVRNNYPFNIPCIQNIDKISFHPRVTYLIGENGMGKSTLMEAIAVALGFNAEGGTKNFNFKTKATHSSLHDYLTFSRGPYRMKDGFFLRGESFYNVASQIDELDENMDGERPGRLVRDSYGGKSLHAQSHGESFWSVFMHRFGGDGLYMLDEPESALSVTRQMAMLVRMNKLVNKRSQFIVATHSPIILAYPNALIYQLTPDGITKVNYKETEAYQLYKRFLDDPQKMTSMLLDDSDDE